MAFDQNAFDVFGEVIDELENLDQAISDLATEIVTRMREEAPVGTGERNPAGDLKRSIKLNLDRYGFRIEMLGYGAFQNYGVNSKYGNPIAMPVEFGVNLLPTSEPFYSFKGGKFGIRPREFFNIEDIEERLIRIIETQIEE